MKCNFLNGRIGRPDLPEGSETCWQCEGTGKRKTMFVEYFGAMKDIERDKTVVPLESTNQLWIALRDYMERHSPVQVVVDYVDGAERYTMEKTA
jgi:hypothetical protein